MRKIMYVFIWIHMLFVMCHAQLVEEKEDSYNFSLNYLYPQRYMQRILWIVHTAFEDLQDICLLSSYADILSKKVFEHVQGIKKAMHDLLIHQEEAQNYLQEDVQEVMGQLRVLDRILIALLSVHHLQEKQEWFKKTHNILCAIYVDAQKLFLINREVIIKSTNQYQEPHNPV